MPKHRRDFYIECCFISFIFIGLTLGKSFYSYMENDKSIPNKVKESNSFKIRLNIFVVL